VPVPVMVLVLGVIVGAVHQPYSCSERRSACSVMDARCFLRSSGGECVQGAGRASDCVASICEGTQAPLDYRDSVDARRSTSKTRCRHASSSPSS
jgi:hypothetical protein